MAVAGLILTKSQLHELARVTDAIGWHPRIRKETYELSNAAADGSVWLYVYGPRGGLRSIWRLPRHGNAEQQ